MTQVLDKGFIRLVDAMGGDSAVVESARVSYGSGAKGEEKDRKLINYLLRHDHMTPFEQAVFKFHVSCPLFVMRQWIRHRMACITGDTKLFFDLPSGIRDNGFKAYPMRVDEFYRKWHEGALPIPLGTKPSQRIAIPQRDRLAQMQLRCVREDSWTIGHTKVTAIVRTGEKPVFEIALEDGKTIRCTKDHRFRFEDGWRTLEDGAGLELHGNKAVYRSTIPRLVVNGRSVADPLYRDREWLETQYSRPDATDASIARMAEVSEHVIRKWRRIHGLINIKPRGFNKGMTSWNKGLTYPLWNGRRELTPRHRAAIREARSGPLSNFWKGGTSSVRAGISRWTTQTSPKVFERDGFRCRSCQRMGGKFHAHHIIPVWADPAKGYDENNLATLCEPCHRAIHRANAELDFATKLLGKEPVETYQKVLKPRPNVRLLLPQWVKITSIRFVGVLPTYDLSVAGPFHNYVANGIVTHNSYNEISARYTEVKDEFYSPDVWRAPDLKNKQSSQASSQVNQKLCRETLEKATQGAYAAYNELIKAGAARELARMVLPVNLYTQFYWTVNARSLMHFITLRADANAQWEIQKYAEALAAVFAEKMPWTWDAYLTHSWKGVNPFLDEKKRLLLAEIPTPR